MVRMAANAPVYDISEKTLQPARICDHLNPCKIERTLLVRIYLTAFLVAGILPAATPEWTRANNLYQRTEYQQSLAILQGAPRKDAPSLQLAGQNFFMLGEYKKACEAFEKAAALDQNTPKLIHWLGRAYGRRAETANPFAAPGLASKTRQ